MIRELDAIGRQASAMGGTVAFELHTIHAVGARRESAGASCLRRIPGTRICEGGPLGSKGTGLVSAGDGAEGSAAADPDAPVADGRFSTARGWTRPPTRRARPKISTDPRRRTEACGAVPEEPTRLTCRSRPARSMSGFGRKKARRARYDAHGGERS